MAVDAEWVPENLDDGHLDWYFFLLAGLMGLTIVYLYYISRNYEYKTTKQLMEFEDEYDQGSDRKAGEEEETGNELLKGQAEQEKLLR